MHESSVVGERGGDGRPPLGRGACVVSAFQTTDGSQELLTGVRELSRMQIRHPRLWSASRVPSLPNTAILDGWKEQIHPAIGAILHGMTLPSVRLPDRDSIPAAQQRRADSLASSRGRRRAVTDFHQLPYLTSYLPALSALQIP